MRGESRKFPRVNSKKVLRVSTLDSVTDEFLVTSDVSSWGCKFDSRVSFGVGRVVFISMFILDKSIKPVGLTVREMQGTNSTYEVGIEFKTISAEDRKILEQLLPEIKPAPDVIVVDTAMNAYLSNDDFYSYMPVNRTPLES